MTVHPTEIREVKERLDALLANPCEETASNVTQAVRRVFRILGLFDEVEEVPREQPSPRAPAPALAGSAAASNMAKQYGYTGEACRKCGGFRVKRTGTCSTCEDCFSNEGCG